jgi:hypothetical protein
MSTLTQWQVGAGLFAVLYAVAMVGWMRTLRHWRDSSRDWKRTCDRWRDLYRMRDRAMWLP